MRNKGFTLIEMMIVVAIVALLASFVLPNYQRFIREARRADAQSELERMRLAQERFRANNTTYGSITDIPAQPSDYYNFAISNAAASTYTIAANAKNGKSQAKDAEGGQACKNLTIDQSGAKTPTACW